MTSSSASINIEVDSLLAPLLRVIVGKPERARQKRALTRRQAISASLGAISQHEALRDKVPLDRSDRAAHVGVVGRRGCGSFAKGGFINNMRS